MVGVPADSIKVYTVNGAVSGSGTALPDWLIRKRTAKGKGKRAIVRENIEGTIDLIQDFEFPEASNKIKSTRDGHHAVATGVYKPQIRVYDLDQMTLKFERHSEAENVDFQILSDDWTKLILLQGDRTVELHTQGGLHYRTRIPKFGRAVAYHYPSCDALLSATGHEVYRLNLDQGRFLNPLTLDAETVQGVNCIDVNPAHQLFSFGTDGFPGASAGVVDFWDPRSRTKVGTLRLPWSHLTPPGSSSSTFTRESFSITSLASRSDGLSLAVGTSTGHTLLYDIRSPRAYAVKDQGYGLPVKCVSWVEGVSNKLSGDGIVISADAKVIKLWDRNTPDANFASITPATDVNYVIQIPSSGLLMAANEGIRMTSYYIPALGPAPKWCSFLDNITEEMEEQTVRTVYDDFKFVDRQELSALGLDQLVGTPALKPYMHGYFMSLQLYDTARAISNPFAYEEHREKVVKEKLEKLADNRIRSSARRNDLPKFKVNKVLAEKIIKTQEAKENKKARRAARLAHPLDAAGETSTNNKDEKKESVTVFNDPRFSSLFENPEFEVDMTSREYALLNPSSVPAPESISSSTTKRIKTAVEAEEEESDKSSSDGLSQHSENDEDPESEQDSSDEGELMTIHAGRDTNVRDSEGLAAALQREAPPQPKMVIAKPSISWTDKARNENASFGERQQSKDASLMPSESKDKVRLVSGGGMEFSFIPTSSGSLFDDGHTSVSTKKQRRKKVDKNIHEFGAGMEKGRRRTELEGEARSGRTKRRTNIRSGSKNTFRKL